MDNIVLLMVAALGGAVNAVAGGGSFLVFPALVLGGMSPIHANATTTMALWPGSVAGAVAYRKKLGDVRGELPMLTLTSLLGGAVGACTLLVTPEQTFRGLIPWLMLAASCIFTFGPTLLGRLKLPERASAARRGLARALQFLIGVYGGYFGAGIGILMLAMLQILGFREIHQMNAIKTILGSAINGLAVLVFVIAGIIVWPKALVMLVGAILGGYIAAHYAQRVNPAAIRRFISVTAFVLTALFFAQSLGLSLDA